MRTCEHGKSALAECPACDAEKANETTILPEWWVWKKVGIAERVDGLARVVLDGLLDGLWGAKAKKTLGKKEIWVQITDPDGRRRKWEDLDLALIEADEHVLMSVDLQIEHGRVNLARECAECSLPRWWDWKDDRTAERVDGAVRVMRVPAGWGVQKREAKGWKPVVYQGKILVEKKGSKARVLADRHCIFPVGMRAEYGFTLDG